MRRALLVLVVALAWPAAAGAQPPTLTLTGPKATRYGHPVDFAGRVSPAATNGLIRLQRGGKTIARARTRPDGSFRFKVELASPGPFRAAWLGASSPSVTVRLHPRLHAAVEDGLLVASALPANAGRLRVAIERDGERTFTRTYGGEARVRLGFALRVRASVELLPAPGFARARTQVLARTVPASLSVGASHPAIAAAARRLQELRYAVASVSSTFSSDFLHTVYAFQKVHGLRRTGVIDAAFWRTLDGAQVPQPRYRTPGDHLEVDKARQVLFVVRDGQVRLVSPVSTAGIPGYFTPVGRFAIFRKVSGYDPSPLGVLLSPMYFLGGYAIHGSPSIPPYPASHGCVRVPNFVINRLFSTEPYGETVYVY